MREISFTMTFRDWREGVRLGVSHLTPFYGAFWTGVPLLTLVGLVLILIGKGHPASWPPARLPPRSVLLDMAPLLGVLLFQFLSSAVVMGRLLRSVTMQIDPKQFVCKDRFWSSAIRWKNVTAILDTGEHLCFCHNLPSSTVIPRAAFPNQAQADAFLEQAAHYWRRETGRADGAPPNAPGVWPPAPRPTDSQEPGGAGGR